MKKLFTWLTVGAFVLSMSLLSMSADDTYRPGWYDDKGFTASDMVQFVIDSSTTAGSQIKRETMTVPVVLATASATTAWTQLFTVPTGQTITIEEILLSAHTEVIGSNDSAWSSIVYYTGSPTSGLDTVVATFNSDSDSATYADTILTLTMIDSVFTAGDIVSFYQNNVNGAATAGVGAAITLLFRRDE